MNVYTIRASRYNGNGTSFDNKLSDEQKKSISETQLDDYNANFCIINCSIVDIENASKRISDKIIEKSDIKKKKHKRKQLR